MVYGEQKTGTGCAQATDLSHCTPWPQLMYDGREVAPHSCRLEIRIESLIGQCIDLSQQMVIPDSCIAALL